MVVFPKHIGHDEMARKLGTPISAGFLTTQINNEQEVEINCYGESVTLGIKSREEEDTKIARRQFSDYL